MKSAKGSAWERKFCGALSLWWTEGRCDGVFWRTANSGGRATVRARKGKQTKSHHGDICAIDPVGDEFLKTFTVELKKGYNSASIGDLLDKPKKSVYGDWIAKLEETYRGAGSRTWMLVHHRDRRLPVVVMPGCVQACLRVPNCMDVSSEANWLAACRLEDFFRIPPNRLELLALEMDRT